MSAAEALIGISGVTFLAGALTIVFACINNDLDAIYLATATMLAISGIQMLREADRLRKENP